MKKSILAGILALAVVLPTGCANSDNANIGQTSAAVLSETPLPQSLKKQI